MATRRYAIRFLALLIACSALVGSNRVAAQNKTYSDFYNQSRNVPGMNVGTNAYLYNKYFYHSPGVSPYLNLGRHGSDSAEAYQLYVRPEIERREANWKAQASYVQQRKLQGNVGYTKYPGALTNNSGNAYRMPTPNIARKSPAYYNHWYGGWNKR